MAMESSAEQPVPLRTVAKAISDWVGRLGRVWVEGQVTEVSRRPGAGTVFLTLRDPVADVSLRVTCSRQVVDVLTPPLQDGARVVVWAKPDFYLSRGSLTLQAFDIRPVGVGELLARLERVKGVLAAEGLFAADRKKRLPFLPRRVGLITGRASAAERDVVENARRRWPAVEFELREVAVQGVYAVQQVTEALVELDRHPEVDVIVIARGGGSLEDLLPFSDESLCRAISAALTPVVSAIGHEPDSPLCDFVADVRCSTPTDAGKRVVPDVGEELARITRAREALHRCLWRRVEHEQTWLDGVRRRPSLANPLSLLDRHAAEVDQLRQRARRCVTERLSHAEASVQQVAAQVRALSPQATLDRGYAVVQSSGGAVVRDPGDTAPGDLLRVRVAGGSFEATRA